MEVRRITPSPSRFVDILKSFDTRLGQQETKAAGNIVIRETLTTTDPATGVQTVFGQLPNGNHGLQLWVGDTEPPPVPATPVVSSALGTITILWSGSFSGTAVAPPDFDHINAYSQNVTGGPVSLAGSMRNSNDSVIFSGVAIPGDKWVCWLTALDANGNESAASVYSAPITVASVLDDSGLSAKLADNQTQIDQANANIATANTAIATKNTISSQSTAPTGAHSGDYWLDSSNGNKAMYYNGAAWVAVQDAAIGQALTTANGKNTIVSASTAPTGTHTVGDTWFDTSNGNRPNTWNGTAWVSAQDASIATAQNAATTAQATANGKNTITYSSSAASGSGINTGDVWFQTNSIGNIIGQWQWSGSAWVQQVIDNSLIAANIDAGKITAGYIAAARIQAQTITSTMIATDTITAGNIAAGAITASEISAGAVTATALSANSVSATAMVANTITAGQIAANTITTNQIAASTITSTNIAASAITADRIAGGTITATQIAVGTITSANIAASAITANKINAGAIDGMVITGAVVRTAASGARIVLDTTSLNAWDGSGVNYLSISQGSVVLQGTAKAIGSVQDGGTNSTTTIAATLGYGFSGTNTGVIGTYAGLGFVNTGVSNENASAVYTTDGQNLNMIAGDIKNTTYPGGGGPARIQLSGTTTTLYSSLSVIAPTSGGVSFQVPSVTVTGNLQVNTIQPTTTSTGITIDAQTYNLHLNGSAVDINHGSGVLTGRYGGGTTAKKLSRGIIANVYFLGVSAFSSTTPSTIINQVMTLEGGTTIRVDFHYAAGANANDLYAAYDILVGSTTIRAYTMAYHISGYGQSCDIWGIYSVPSTGSYNVSITGQVAAGAGTVSTGSSSTSNAPQVHMLVTDLG